MHRLIKIPKFCKILHSIQYYVFREMIKRNKEAADKAAAVEAAAEKKEAPVTKAPEAAAPEKKVW
jgi:hypothetical protein